MLFHFLLGGPAQVFHAVVLLVVIEVDDILVPGALLGKKCFGNEPVQEKGHVPPFRFEFQRGIPPHEGTFEEVTVLDTGGVADQPSLIGDGIIAAEDPFAEIDHFPLFICDGFYHEMGVGWGFKSRLIQAGQVKWQMKRPG